MKIKNPSKVKFGGLLIILCGYPSSGKSSFAEKLKLNFNLSEILSSVKDNIVIIDTDSIRKDNFGSDFNYENESEVRSLSIKSVKKSLKEALIVISDDINYFTSMRHEFAELANRLKKPYFIIHISTPLDTCLKWNSGRNNPIEDEIIKGIADKFDIPGKKYKWDKPFVSVNLLSEKLNQAALNTVKKIELTYLEKYDLLKRSENSTNVKQIVPKKLEAEAITRILVGIYSDYVFQGNSFQKLNDQKTSDPLKKKILRILISPEKESNKLFLENVEKYGESIDIINKKRKNFINISDQVHWDLQQIIFEFLHYIFQN
jgi:O-phosphoseryl-tRNA(Sec) kinase